MAIGLRTNDLDHMVSLLQNHIVLEKPDITPLPVVFPKSLDIFPETSGVASMGSLNLEKALWRSSAVKVKNKAMARADRRLSKFAAKAEEGRTYTLHEIAQAMGVTRERVRQIEARALRKLYNRLGQVFRNENITPGDAMDTVRRVGRGGLEHRVVGGDDNL